MIANNIEQFKAAIQNAGLNPPDHIECGKFIRFPGADKSARNTAAWCKLFDDGRGGTFGDYSSGLSLSWQAERSTAFSQAERDAFKRQIAEAKQQRDAEEKARHAEAATKAATIWEAATPAPDNHPYLVRKGIKASGAKVSRGSLVIPMRAGGKVLSLQFIDANGFKKFLSGGLVTGGCFSIGNPDGAKVLCIAEGFATGATIHEVTGYPVAVAFNAGNLLSVAQNMRGKFPDLRLIVCADDDVKTAGNPGITKATEAARSVNGLLAIPDFGAERDPNKTDFNDMAEQCGVDAVREVITSVFESSGISVSDDDQIAVVSDPVSEATPKKEVSEQKGFEFVQARDLLSKPEAVPWLIDGMIERGSLSTLFGASGCGKSFMAIDWSCCIATGSEWNGKETEQGAVFYIAGEGHAGIRRRLKAWETHADISLQDAPLFISTCPAALMDAGSALSVANAVDLLVDEHGTPNLIVIDTLARNLGNGEENSNADIGLFINNIDVLLRTRFDATVLIIHHTGWADTERARGASAMRAAMDSEYRLDLKTKLHTLVCTKAKESEALKPMSFTLNQIVLDGWIKSDGELMTSAVLVSSAETPEKKSKGLTNANRIALAALTHAISSDGEPPTDDFLAAMNHGNLAPKEVVHEDVWRQRAYDEGISDGEQGAKKKSFARSRKYLLDNKLVSTWKDLYWIGGFAPTGEQIKPINGTRDTTGQSGTFVPCS